MNDWRRARLLLLPAAMSACNVHLGNSENSVIVAGRVRSQGQPVSGATVSSLGVTAFTDSSGDYSLSVKTARDRVAVDVKAPGYAPNIALVRHKDGVYHYAADVELTAPQLTLAANDLTKHSLSVADQTIVIELGPTALPSGATLEVTALLPENSPGGMETTEASDSLLQAGATVYLRALSASGSEVALQDQGVTVGSLLTADIGQAEPVRGYTLAEEAVWTPATKNEVTSAVQHALLTGYFSAARSFKPACVRGKLKAPKKSCSGQKVIAAGRNVPGLFSTDNAGAAGEFCIEAPIGLTRTLMVGATTKSITFGKSAGSCHASSSACSDVGEVEVTDNDCARSCDKGLVDTPIGCRKPGEMTTKVGCGSEGFGGCSALGTQYVQGQLGDGCCLVSSCDKGGNTLTCVDSCSNGWYEAQGQVFGPCADSLDACSQDTAAEVVRACMK